MKYKECTLGALFCVHILNYTPKHWFNSSNNAVDLLVHDCITKHDTISSRLLFNSGNISHCNLGD